MAAILALACTSREPNPADSVAAESASLPAPASMDSVRPTLADPCPATGRWELCSLEKRLKRSGFVAERIEDDSARRPGFEIVPAVYKLGRGRLEVFLYETEEALAKDIAGLDTLSVTPPGATGVWPSPPTLIRSGNLAAVFMDQTPRQAERLVLAITAGAPLAR